MAADQEISRVVREPSGAEMYSLCERLYPITRSITGDGVRETLDILASDLPLIVHEVPSGTEVFDWIVPPEWNVDDAYVADANGRRVIDIADHNLHLVSYSEPVHETLTLDELKRHLHTLPGQPDYIPYRTSYYDRSWGFCLSHRQLESLPAGKYEVVIDSRLEAGSLTYGECVFPGELPEEILVWTHVCHPSLANDNLSGISVAWALARYLGSLNAKPKYTYRLVFAPSTIGAITWIARNEPQLKRIVAGLVISGVGSSGAFTYKNSRHPDSVFDRLFAWKLRSAGYEHSVVPFSPYGYDERQFCSPGIDLPVGCLMRTPFGLYPEYHTSADDLNFISGQSLIESFELCRDVLVQFQWVASYSNLSPKCEPQLGRRGLYEAIGGDNDKRMAQMALLWMLNFSDGRHTTLDIAEMSGIDLETLHVAAGRLSDAGLLGAESLPRLTVQ